ncbi:MAG: carbon-nitrogen hydrolase family protein [Acidobacteria bacterium]|nr:carbon-nitrogen hydrolase family protein [Acidobacteriota bacterium]
MRHFAIAGIQLEIKNNADNMIKIRAHLDNLLDQFPWVQMVVLSELAACGHDVQNAQPEDGPLEQAFCQMAKKHGIWLIPGSMYQVKDHQLFNVAPVINPEGEVVGRHKKMFPFAPYEQGITPGTEPFVFDVPDVGRFGVSICYDMWFPETTRWLVCQGAEVIIHPTFTDTIDRDVELAIVRATAAQNQCFVIDVNGLDDGGNGRSIFVGPSGDVLHQCGTHSEDVPIEIDLDRVSRGRELGLRGLGQPLKSFRDRAFDFPCYQKGYRSQYLNALGRLEKPKRGTPCGINKRPK